MSAVTVVACIAFMPAIWEQWVELGRDWANIYYFFNLVINIAHALIIIDFVKIKVYSDVLEDNPGILKSQLYQQ